MKKKKFWIAAAAVLFLAAMVFLGVLVYKVYQKHQGILSAKELEELNISREEVVITGLTREYNLFYLADAHISLCDQRDEEVQEKADQRLAAFVDENGVQAPETFKKMVKAANTLESDLVVLGGDIIDSAMYASIDFLKEELSKLKMPYLYYMGNHDFEYGSEYFSNKAFEEYLPRLKELTTEEMYQIAEYDDWILFTANDKNNQIDKTALEAFKGILDKGKPIVVALHVPIEPFLEDQTLLQDTIDVWGLSDKGRGVVTMGENSCKPKKNTRKFLDLILAEDSPVELVLAGHIHFYHKDHLTNQLVQIVTGAGYEKSALSVTLKPEAEIK